MRLLLSSVLAAGLMASPAMAATCAQPAEHTAMDVTALKTQLMVIALTCRADDNYNAFILKYRPDLVQTDKTLASFFNRSFGKTGAKQRDDYVTQLANSQSQTGLKQGSLFCARNTAVFDEVMALRSGELVDFAAGKAGVQPISIVDCVGGHSAPAASRSTARRRS